MEQELLAKAVEAAVNATSSALRPLAPKLDANPHGVEAFALVAVLRAFADLLAEELPKDTQGEVSKLQEHIVKALKQGV